MNDENVPKIIRDFVKNQTDIIIDRYSPDGGNADLYFGRHKIFNDRVCLKFYYVDVNKIAHDEPRILRKLKHENILKIYDARVIADKYAYILSPEIIGGDLQTVLAQNKFSTFESFDIISDVLKGLSELHKNPNRIVHRDIKADNIFINNKGRAVIADFGSARRIENGEISTVSSRYTRIYRSPEAILGKTHSFQSDLYQVGVILFQLLGGNFYLQFSDYLSQRELSRLGKISDPRERIDFEDQIIDNKIIKGKLFDINSLPDYVDKRLVSVIKKSMNPNLLKRYKSSSSFMNDLYKYKNKVKSWRYGDDGLIYAENKNDIYRVSSDKKGSFCEKKQKNGNWRKLKNDRVSVKDCIKLINSK